MCGGQSSIHPDGKCPYEKIVGKDESIGRDFAEQSYLNDQRITPRWYTPINYKNAEQATRKETEWARNTYATIEDRKTDFALQGATVVSAGLLPISLPLAIATYPIAFYAMRRN